MKTIKVILAAAFLAMAVLQVSAAFANTNAQDEIQQYTSFIKTQYGVDVFAKVQNKKALKELGKLDLFLEGQIDLPAGSLKLVDCDKPVCENGGF